MDELSSPSTHYHRNAAKTYLVVSQATALTTVTPIVVVSGQVMYKRKLLRFLLLPNFTWPQ